MARKLCATELFSARRVDSFERVRAQEMRALVRGLLAECAGAGRGAVAVAVAVREHVAGATLRNILRMAVGEKWAGCYGSPEGEAFRRTLDEAFAVTGAVSNVGEWVPWLGWLDLQGCVRRMRRLRAQYDRFFEQILADHEKTRRRRGRTGTGGDSAAGDDLVDVLLQLAEEDEDRPESEASSRLTRDGVKAFVQDIVAGGTESSAVTIEWAMSELLRHPEAMAAATAELDRAISRTSPTSTPS
jgi:cytochrome P450